MTDEHEVLERLDRIERLLREQKAVRDYYSTAEFAEIARLAEFTVREHCRLGRLDARKKRSGRGRHSAWVLSHAELLRFQREGLLPDVSRTRP